MTVEQMIEELKRYPKERLVLTLTDVREFEPDRIEDAVVETVEVVTARGRYGEDLGSYFYAEESEEDEEGFMAIVIR